MRPRIRALLFLLLWFVPSLTLVPAAPAGAARQSDEPELRTLVEQLYQRYARKDLDGYCGLWDARSPALERRREQLRRSFGALDKIELTRISVVKWAREGVKAQVRLRANFDYVRGGAPRSESINRWIECVRTAEGWRVANDLVAEDVLATRAAAAPTAAARAAVLAEDDDLVNNDFLRAVLGLGSQAADRGDFSGAMALFQFAEKLADERRLPAGQARALDRLGSLHHRLGNFPAAIAAYRQSLALLQQLQNAEGVFAVQNNLGSALAELGDAEAAIEAFTKSLQAGKGIAEDKERLAVVDTNIANAYSAVGNYARAAQHLNRSLQLSEALGDRGRQAIALNSLSVIHVHQGEFDLAETLLRKSLALTEQTEQKAGLGETLNNLALILAKTGREEEALALHRRGLERRIALRDRLGESQSLNNIGLLYERRKQYAEALPYFRKSLALAEEIGAQGRIANSLISLATVQFDQGEYPQALASLERAQAIARKTGNRETLAHISDSAGRILALLHRNEEAHRAYEESIRAVEELRSNVAGGEQQQERFFENMQAPYLGRTLLLLDEGKPMEALQSAERTRSRVLLDVLRSGRVDIAKAMSAEERAREKALGDDLASLNTQLYRENLRRTPDTARVADLTERLRRARAELDLFQTRLYSSHPELKIQRGETAGFDLQSVAGALLDPDTALLEYVVAEDKTWLFVLTREKGAQDPCAPCPALRAYEMPIGREALNRKVEQFRRQLAEHDLRFNGPAAELYALLVRQAMPQLQGRKRLIVVRDAGLWELPFQALRAESGRYLIEEYAVSYAPSLTALAEMRRIERARKSEARPLALLAFGNPAFGAPPGETGRRGGAGIAPLPSAEREVQQLAKLYPGKSAKILSGADATEGRFKAEAGTAEILHLATHAILNDASPMYSQIVLAQSSAEPAADDGLLEAWEIMRLDLRADLVVLSACETGRGRIGAGEGLIGLTWAFFVAGAPATVVSQWEVDAESTSDLMQEFHGALRALPKDEALRAAELKLLRNPKYRHPFYWASFSLVGVAR